MAWRLSQQTIILAYVDPDICHHIASTRYQWVKRNGMLKSTLPQLITEYSRQGEYHIFWYSNSQCCQIIHLYDPVSESFACPCIFDSLILTRVHNWRYTCNHVSISIVAADQVKGKIQILSLQTLYFNYFFLYSNWIFLLWQQAISIQIMTHHCLLHAISMRKLYSCGEYAWDETFTLDKKMLL